MIYGVEASEDSDQTHLLARASESLRGKIDFVANTYVWGGVYKSTAAAVIGYSGYFGSTVMSPNGLFVREDRNSGGAYLNFGGAYDIVNFLQTMNWGVVVEVDTSTPNARCYPLVFSEYSGNQYSYTELGFGYFDYWDADWVQSISRLSEAFSGSGDPNNPNESPDYPMVPGIYRLAVTRTNAHLSCAINGHLYYLNDHASNYLKFSNSPYLITLGTWPGNSYTGDRFLIRSISVYSPRLDGLLTLLSKPPVGETHTQCIEQAWPLDANSGIVQYVTVSKRWSPIYINGGSASTSASAATLTPALPGSRTTHNILIAACQVNAGSKTFSVGGGWQIFSEATDGASSACLAWRNVDGTEAAPVFSWTGAAACSAIVRQFGTASAAYPLIAVGSFASAVGTSTAPAVGAITTTREPSLVLAFLMASGSNQTIPIPAGFSSVDVAASANGSYRTAYQLVALKGTNSSALAATITSANWHAFLVELIEQVKLTSAVATGAVGALVRTDVPMTGVAATGTAGTIGPWFPLMGWQIYATGAVGHFTPTIT